jgi:hypothetical protein
VADAVNFRIAVWEICPTSLAPDIAGARTRKQQTMMPGRAKHRRQQRP